MFDPNAHSPKPLFEFAPRVLSQSGSDTLPTGVGGFQLSAYYSGERSKLARRQFTGKATLNLHDPEDGEAAVAISDIASMSLAYVRSTGHDVALSELQMPNLLVPVTGTLSCRNAHMLFERKNEPWLLIGRGIRETTVLPAKNAGYQAFVLSIPPQLLGDRVKRVEARGGMVCGDVSRDDDLHLARLTLALAAQVCLSGSGGTAMEPRLAKAWTTVIVEQMNACLDACLGTGVREPSDQGHDLSLIHVQRAEELMHERPNEIGSLRDVAQHVGVSERTLQAAFRKVRGATPTQVLSQARLQCARHALLHREGPNTVSEVCSMCGIEHHGRFSKLYKEAFGEYPVVTLASRGTR